MGKNKYLLLSLFAWGCSDVKDGATPSVRFAASTVDTRFNVAEHFMTSIEMQITGEPFAELIGRDLAGYDRFNRNTDRYFDPSDGQDHLDPMGYAFAIEEYEYSKQPMNNTSFEAGAGMSLMFGPVLNPNSVNGDPAVQLLRDRFQHLGGAAHATGSLIVSPAPVNNPLNIFGWPGLWPIFAEYQSFLPTISPSIGAVRGCTFDGGYAAAGTAQTVGDYECGYTSLNLPLRDVQVTKALSPSALGYAAWKQGLWVINYWQALHDLQGNQITAIADADMGQVAIPGNVVVGQYPDPANPDNMINSVPGVYLGDTALEGWQGLLMLEELHNKAVMLLQQITTTDGSSLSGFASTAAALAYDYHSPLRWWPSLISVTEDANGGAPAAGNSWRLFPIPTHFTIADNKSRLRDLMSLAGGFGELFSLTDFNNPDIGGQPSSRATFDGDPFPADNQMTDGEDTPRDRALAVMKVALVNLDRIHFDPQNHVLVDEAQISSGQVQRGTQVTTHDAAYAIVALRNASRSIASSLTLYSNDKPDTLGVATALDDTSQAGASVPLPERINQLIVAQADFILNRLVDSVGKVANGIDLSTGLVYPEPTQLSSEAAAIRGLLEAYLATGNTQYRNAAQRVFADMDGRFWMPDAKIYRTVVGESQTLVWTTPTFGALEGALRQYWTLVVSGAGDAAAAKDLLERMQRVNKLILNGWDDRNGDNLISYPDECTGAGLQMAERALTGELSRPSDHGDRDHDCVKEIGQAQLPSALAAQIVLNRQ